MSDTNPPTRRYPEGFPVPGDAGAASGSAGDAPTERFTPAEEAAATTPSTAPPAAPPATPTAATTVLPGTPSAPPPGTPPTASGDGDDGGKSKRTVIILAVAAAALIAILLGVIVGLLMAGNGSPSPDPTDSDTPSTSPSPSETPSESPSPSPSPSETTAPEPTDVIASFTASASSVDCTGQGGGSVPLGFSWATSGTRLWFGIGTDDAQAEPYAEFPATYATTAADGIEYQCGQEERQQRYTITVERPDGSVQSETLVITES